MYSFDTEGTVGRDTGKWMFFITLGSLLILKCDLLALVYFMFGVVLVNVEIDETDYEDRMTKDWMGDNRDMFQLAYQTWKIPMWVRLSDIEMQDLIDAPFIDDLTLPENYVFLSDFRDHINLTKRVDAKTRMEKNLYISTEMFKKYKITVSQEFKDSWKKLFFSHDLDPVAKLRHID